VNLPNVYRLNFAFQGSAAGEPLVQMGGSAAAAPVVQPLTGGSAPVEPKPVIEPINKKKEKRVREIFVPPNGDLELQVDPGLMDNWRKAFPALDVENQIERAELWLNANPANRKSNYERFLLNWLTRAQDSAPRVNAQRMTPAPAATGRRPVHPSWYAGSTTHPTQETGHVFDVVATEVTQ
jgi:hypothetical protein